MAHELEARFGGTIPQDPESLRSLPGVSDYIAGAVICFSRDVPEVFLDTNIVRVVGRLMGLPISDSSRRSRSFREALARLLPVRGSRAVYFAIIDLAATVCRPRNPNCPSCPVERYCVYRGSLDLARIQISSVSKAQSL
jgi:A/G-specific adenine glycosylase